MNDNYNAADAKQIKKRKQDLKADEAVRLKDLEELLKSPTFRRFIYNLVGVCRYFKLSYTGDRNSTDFNEGVRSVGSYLYDDIQKAHPKAFYQIMQEGEDRVEIRKEKDRDRSSSDDDGDTGSEPGSDD